MPTETLAPDAIISSSNLSGAVTDIDEPVDVPWTPADFPSVTGWWEASDLAGQGDGTDVTAWSDKVASNHWGQRASGNLPDKETATYQYVDFLQSNSESLDMAGVLSAMIGSTGLLAVVVYLNGNPSITTTPGFFDCNGIMVDSAGFYGMAGQTQAGDPRILCGIYDGATKTVILSTSINTIHVAMMWRTSGGDLVASLDGIEETPVASGAPSTQTGVLQLGCDFDANVFFNGRVYAVMTSTANGSIDDRASLLAYWQTKFGL